ncbi:TPA: amidohydrolase [Candidatus Micrarchaeota archaeon]|nr:amidohydrolase [Candidatus Micrarchaeota archaeon]
MSLLIKNASLPSGKKTDVLVEGGKISKIGSFSSNAEEKLDASGKLLIPGLINTHTHAAMTLFRGIAEDMELAKWLSSVRRAEMLVTPPQIRAGTDLAILEMIRSGTTCFSDMYFHMDEVAASVLESGMRAVLGYSMVDGGNAAGTQQSANEKKMNSELSIAEKFVKDWHGKAEGRITSSIPPHSIYLCSGELLKKSHQLSEKYGVVLHIHLSETRKEVFDCLKANGKRPSHYLDSLRVLSRRTVAAHCVWLTKEEVKLLAGKGVSASLNPVSNMKLAGGGASPMPEMEKSGMNISLGTDGSASNNSLSMFETIKFAALLQKNARWDASVASAESVFQAATLGGARALGIPAGEIKEGKLADLVLVDAAAPNMVPSHSIVANIAYAAHAGNVTDVIINGKVVMRERKVLTMDEEKIVERAQKEAERLS